MALWLLFTFAVCSRQFDYSNGYRLASVQGGGVVFPADDNVASTGSTGDQNYRWANLKADILALQQQGRKKVAAFDIDGTLVRERPVLGELQCAREIVCLEARESITTWPLETTSYAELCGGPKWDDAKNLAPMPDMSKEQKYELLLKPFAGQSIQNVRSKIKQFIPRHDFTYKAFHDLITKLSRKGWSILFVSVSFNDFVHAFAEVYFPGMDYEVLSSEPETTEINNELHRSLTGKAALVLDTWGKVEQITQWGLETYDDAHVPPLLAMGNTVTDAAMCHAADRAGGLCVMVEHDSAKECGEECEYELWSNLDQLMPQFSKVFPEKDQNEMMWKFQNKNGNSGVHIVALSELPDPLFCAPDGTNPCGEL